MKPHDPALPVLHRALRPTAIVALALLLLAPRAAAQQPPPVTGGIALKGTTNKVYAAANRVIVATLDGVGHVVRYAKDLLGIGSGGDKLPGLDEGAMVLVRRTAADGTVSSTEGIVTHVDHAAGAMTVRLDRGVMENLQLSDQAPASSGVSVSYADDSGHQVTRAFTDVP